MQHLVGIYGHDMCCITITPVQSGKITLLKPPASVANFKRWIMFAYTLYSHINLPNFTATLKKYFLALDWGMVLTSHSVAFHVVHIIFCLVCVFTALNRGLAIYLQQRPHMTTYNNLRSASIRQIHEGMDKTQISDKKAVRTLLVCSSLTYSAV